MPVTILIGAQWGDEGKGRFVDNLAARADVVARFAGGDNAGHTVAIGSDVYKLHLIPSGILHEGVVGVMGNGMVINPVNLLAEMDALRERGVALTPANLKISARAHLITPAHIAFDRAKEAARGDGAIGTTLRGIGPAYLDKTGRQGLRLGQMLDVATFADDLRAALVAANASLAAGGESVDIVTSVQRYVEAAHRLRQYIVDTSLYINDRLRDGAQVVAEGAQGTLLDVDHGSYPYVTSSSPSVGGAMTGLGIGPRHVERVIGVAKAFSTRVGGGPMPTELHDAVADHLRGTGENYWDEYGTTTGRKRRCGWLDGVMLRYAAHINGFTELVVTKLDILTGLEEIKIATSYEIDGQRVAYPPTTISALARAVPVYETLPGWDNALTALRAVADLPDAVQTYLGRISALVGVPVTAVSVGPEREHMVSMA